jgi:hypothetical protein
MKITEKQIKKGLAEYQYFLIDRTGGFTKYLFQSIAYADNINLNKLAQIYPEYVYAYLDYTGMLYKVPFEVIKD